MRLLGVQPREDKVVKVRVVLVVVGEGVVPEGVLVVPVGWIGRVCVFVCVCYFFFHGWCGGGFFFRGEGMAYHRKGLAIKKMPKRPQSA